MDVPEAQAGSWEDALQQAGAFDKYILFNQENERDFDRALGHRAIGVVYDPELEHLGNYVPSYVARRYDAFIFINETKANILMNLKTSLKMGRFGLGFTASGPL